MTCFNEGCRFRYSSFSLYYYCFVVVVVVVLNAKEEATGFRFIMHNLKENFRFVNLPLTCVTVLGSLCAKMIHVM